MKNRIYTSFIFVSFGVTSAAFWHSARVSRNFNVGFISKSPNRHVPGTKTLLYDSIEKEVDKSQANIIADVQAIYPSANVVTKELSEHRPLGCTIEESMDTVNDPAIVFVSKVVQGGNADKAGIKVGDVLVGVTGLFGDMTPVLKSGVEKIKGLVASVPDDEPLLLQLARKTGVFERHEASIVDVCQSPGKSDKDVEECVVKFLSSGYEIEVDEGQEVDDGVVEEDESDSLIDSMMNTWASELPLPPTTSGIMDGGDEGMKAKPKPWSSRSSPSGTFVRDPVTGEMRNIDA